MYYHRIPGSYYTDVTTSPRVPRRKPRVHKAQRQVSVLERGCQMIVSKTFAGFIKIGHSNLKALACPLQF